MLFQHLENRDQKTVQRILKVNHAGEYGAIRIYRAQLIVARIFLPLFDPIFGRDIVPRNSALRSFP